MTLKKWSMYTALIRNYDQELSHSGVSGDRLAERLTKLSMIGRTEDHGSDRPGFSQREREAKDTVIGWMHEAGLNVQQDGAGNVIGRLEGRDPSVLQ